MVITDSQTTRTFNRRSVNRGLPQGAVNSPTLISIYTNDLPEAVFEVQQLIEAIAQV